MRICLTVFLTLLCAGLSAQSVMSCDTVGSESTAPVYSCRLRGDSLSSAFCIVIRDEVPPHFHRTHSEQVIVLSGTGIMLLDGKRFAVREGDVISIPKNTVHAVKVTGKVPLRVISVQAPYFDGTDRVKAKE